MSGQLNGARLCAAFLVLFFSSVTFAQVSQVADRGSLAGDDFIDWTSQPAQIPSPSPISTDGGMAVTVGHAHSPGYVGTSFFPSNIPAGDYLYYTWHAEPDLYNYVNPINFTEFGGIDGGGICGFGTQIAPLDAGEFVAWIEAFYDGGSKMFAVTANTGDAEAAFLGVESTDPMNRVEVSIQSTAGGSGYYSSLYVINQVDLKACVEEPEAPMLYCEGFAAPMDNYPVKAKGNRVFPLIMELFDAEGYALTDAELVAAPVVTVTFTSADTSVPVDVTDDVLAPGKATEGNTFVFGNDVWQFNLSSKNYKAEGTYMVTAVSGDDLEYVIDPSCVTSFAR